MRKFDEVRELVWQQARSMHEAGLVRVSAGNISARVPFDVSLIAMTPTSIPWERLERDQISIIRVDDGGSIEEPVARSSEGPLHLAIYRARPDVGGVVHTHSPHVSALSILRLPLPPVIDEMAAHFGGEVPVADYAFTGTEELASNVTEALAHGPAIILSNHGNVCVGDTLPDALELAVRMEAAAEIYVLALCAGRPVPLPDDAIMRGRKLYEKWKSRR